MFFRGDPWLDSNKRGVFRDEDSLILCVFEGIACEDATIIIGFPVRSKDQRVKDS